ncbi:MAG TPA: hypothetical protein VMB27_01860 [Solirubrobacteraceae bacterium]|nr:hypothetical protein [Solirubrobacteraceae bacterium]
MTSGSWPYFPRQCPECLYFHSESPPWVDDSGYEVVGFCRQPRIGMELFKPQKLELSGDEHCPVFVRKVVSDRSATESAPRPADDADVPW